MKININDYVRVDNKYIAKCDMINDDYFEFDSPIYYDFGDPVHSIRKDKLNSNYYQIEKSENIISLLKPNDIVLGKDGNIYKVSEVWKDYVFTNSFTNGGFIKTLVDYQIDKVLTREQFENNAYEVE